MSQYILLDVAVAKTSNKGVTDVVVGVIDCFKRAVFRELAGFSLPHNRAAKLLTSLSLSCVIVMRVILLPWRSQPLRLES